MFRVSREIWMVNYEKYWTESSLSDNVTQVRHIGSVWHTENV